MSALLAFTEIVPVVSDLERVVEDPDDDVIVNTAVDGRADFIVTGDKALLDVAEYAGIEILPVARFLREILQGA